MANKPRIVSVMPKINTLLKSTGQRVFDLAYLQSIFEVNNDKWRLPLSMDIHKFINDLGVYNNELVIHKFEFPYIKEQVIAHLEEASIYEIGSSIFPNSYLSHYSAITLWGLSEQIPKSIYITLEQSAGPAKSVPRHLKQSAIDEAFRKPQRISETVNDYLNHRLILLRGKQTKRLGVITLEKTGQSVINVTDIERTLIDIAVRPAYSGGIFEVLKAYRLAKEMHSVSINKISSYLTKLDFIYPYHQAIGFYIERAGNYSDKMLDILRRKPKEYDFYLTYGAEPEKLNYSKEWRIFYPKSLD